MNKERIQVLLDPETIKSLNKEAKEKSISVSAVIRQKVEAMYKFKDDITKAIKSDIENFSTPEITKGYMDQYQKAEDDYILSMNSKSKK